MSLVNRLGLHPGEASGEVRLAARVSDHLPGTASALATGEIGPAAVAVIADTDAELATFATATDRAAAEALPADHARRSPVRGLSHAALHLRNRLDPDQGQRLADDEQAHVARREFRMRMHPDGSSRPDGYLDKEATAFLRAALDPLAKPRPAADGTPDPRSPAQRTGDALIELVELAALRRPPHPGRSARSAPQRSGGSRDCQVIPMVLGSHGEPLDVGPGQPRRHPGDPPRPRRPRRGLRVPRL